jgi:hypothetical protein
MDSTAPDTSNMASLPMSSAREYPNSRSSAPLTAAISPFESTMATAAGSASNAC